MVKIYHDEAVEPLTKYNRFIIQNKKGYRFAIDAVLLANFVRIDKKSDLLEIGTGTGIIPLLIVDNDNINKIKALEIQDGVADMAKRSVAYNNLENKIEIVNIDVNHMNNTDKYDVIISNPPYMKKNDGKISENMIKAISRHEIKLDLDNLLINSYRLLKSGGSLNLIYRSNRYIELINLATRYKFFPKRIRHIYPKPNSVSNLFMIELIKDKKNETQLLEPLYIFNNENHYTEEVVGYY